MTTKMRTSRRSIRLVLLLMVPALLAAQRGKAKPGQPYAVVAGTVFRDPGFAQPGAKVVLTLKASPKKTLQESVTSRRGEFTFRVLAGPQTYVVTATLKGFKPVRQEIAISGEEQINETLVLVPESKQERR